MGGPLPDQLRPRNHRHLVAACTTERAARITGGGAGDRHEINNLERRRLLWGRTRQSPGGRRHRQRLGNTASATPPPWTLLLKQLTAVQDQPFGEIEVCRAPTKEEGEEGQASSEATAGANPQSAIRNPQSA